MNKETAAEISISACVIAAIIAFTTLIALFGGQPDIADRWLCESLKATPKQCAALSGLNTEKNYTTSETTTTSKDFNP